MGLCCYLFFIPGILSITSTILMMTENKPIAYHIIRCALSIKIPIMAISAIRMKILFSMFRINRLRVIWRRDSFVLSGCRSRSNMSLFSVDGIIVLGMRNNHNYIYSNNAFYFWRGMLLTIRSYSIAVVCCILYLLLIPFLCQRHRESFFFCMLCNASIISSGSGTIPPSRP